MKYLSKFQRWGAVIYFIYTILIILFILVDILATALLIIEVYQEAMGSIPGLWFRWKGNDIASAKQLWKYNWYNVFQGIGSK